MKDWKERPWRIIPNRVWRTYRGGKCLDMFHGQQNCADSEYPEEWIGSTVVSRNAGLNRPKDDGLSHVETGTGITRLLSDLLMTYPLELLGAEHVSCYGASPGILVKLIDSVERLSFQVHPTREQAQALFKSPFGKTEGWVILDVRPEAVDPAVYLGFRPGVNKGMLERCLESNDEKALLDSLHRIPVQSGDVLFVPAGTPHAIGGGLMLLEIQEPTDLTISVDAGGKNFMGLPLDSVLELFKLDCLGYEETVSKYKQVPLEVLKSHGRQEYDLFGRDTSGYFGVTKVESDCEVPINRGAFYIAVMLEGKGVVRFGGQEWPIGPGDAWFVPHRVREGSWIPDSGEKLSMLCCSPPQRSVDL